MTFERKDVTHWKLKEVGSFDGKNTQIIFSRVEKPEDKPESTSARGKSVLICFHLVGSCPKEKSQF